MDLASRCSFGATSIPRRQQVGKGSALDGPWPSVEIGICSICYPKTLFGSSKALTVIVTASTGASRHLLCSLSSHSSDKSEVAESWSTGNVRNQAMQLSGRAYYAG